MSGRDQELVQSLGVSVSVVASALNKSRQTVNRGIRAAGDYFKPRDLIQALEFWGKSDSALYSVARTKICEMYPEVAEAIAASADTGPSPFSTEVPGEYWFVTGDFPNFRTNLPVCSDQLEALSGRPDVQIKLIVNKRDFSVAHRFAARFEKSVEPVLCKNINFQFVPSTLLRIDHLDKMDLFGVSDTGFTPLSRQEAARLRAEIEQTFLGEQNEDQQA